MLLEPWTPTLPYKMAGLDNFYIEALLKRFTKDFKGVFSADNIPAKLLQLDKFIIVCNLSKHGEEGSHFVTIVAHPNDTLYIDPLGLQCFVPEISSYLKRRGNPVIYNTRQVQSERSIFCGYFAIFYSLLFDSSNDDNDTEFNFYSVHLSGNDKRCVKYIKQLVSRRNK
jgi:hypothetical protein